MTLDVDENIIRIGAKRSESSQKEEESPDKRWHRSERRSYSDFQQRALRMPENTDFSKLRAAFDNGTLTIDVAKVPEKKLPEPEDRHPVRARAEVAAVRDIARLFATLGETLRRSGETRRVARAAPFGATNALSRNVCDDRRCVPTSLDRRGFFFFFSKPIGNI